MRYPAPYRLLVLFAVLVLAGWALYRYRAPLRGAYLRYKLSKAREERVAAMNTLKVERLVIGNSLVADGCFEPGTFGYQKFGTGGEVIKGVVRYMQNTDTARLHGLVVWIGLNDILNGHSISRIQKDYQKLFQYIQKEGMDLYVLGIPRIDLPQDGFFVQNDLSNKRIGQVNNYLGKESLAWGYHFIDVNAIFAENTDIHRQDGVHLSCNAYTMLQNAIKGRIGSGKK